MDYANLKREIKEIADIAAGVPEPFGQKCFEILLSHLLKPESGNGGENPPPPPPGNIPIPAQLRVFMQRTGVTEDQLKQLILYADGDVHFIKEPTAKKVSKGQMSWALLLALKNCILNNSMSVDSETIRSVCQEKGFYDKANFAAYLKKPNYKKLFKGSLEPQGDAQALTNEGQKELAALIQQLTSTT